MGRVSLCFHKSACVLLPRFSRPRQWHSSRVRGNVVSSRNWPKLENMLTHFPMAVPEIPVSNVEKAAEYYVNGARVPFRLG